MLEQVFGEEVMLRAGVFIWYKWLSDGTKLSLSTSELDEKAKKMRTLAWNDQCLAAGVIVEELNVSGGDCTIDFD
jgi:hypothetical protein